MIILSSIKVVEKARLPPQLVAAATKILQSIHTAHGLRYDPEQDGFLVIITPTDTDASISEKLGRKWQESCFEGVHYDEVANSYIAVILRDNQFAISILIPDEPWLDPDIRKRILQEIG